MKPHLDYRRYVSRDQDGTWEAELKDTLVAETEEDRANFLVEVLAAQEGSGLSTRPWFDLARSVLRDSSSFEVLLRRGLRVSNVSTIRNWLECCVPRLGVRRVIRILEQEDEVHPHGVELAEYWLAGLAKTPSERSLVSAFLQAPARVARQQRRKGGSS